MPATRRSAPTLKDEGVDDAISNYADAPEAQSEGSGWSFEATIYFWALAMEGESTIAGRSADSATGTSGRRSL